MNEIGDSLKMKREKCSGIDGLPSEFLKVFWPKLKYFVLQSLKGIWKRKMLIT